MKNYEYVFFDLDGTVTDPAEGITNSVAYALSKYGIEVTDKTSLYDFIGPPLIDSFMKHYSFSREKAVDAVEKYREYYRVKGIFENKLYNGITELLENLKKSGKKVVLATSKPEKFAVEILKHFKIYELFDFVAGATMDETRTDKSEVIKYAIDSLSIIDVSKIIMVGDRKYDIEGAHKFGIKAIGVNYGYGSFEELKNADSDYIVSNPKEIEEILI